MPGPCAAENFTSRCQRRLRRARLSFVIVRAGLPVVPVVSVQFWLFHRCVCQIQDLQESHLLKVLTWNV
jgi:hypothetical protein